jgi:hypothetical protein
MPLGGVCRVGPRSGTTLHGCPRPSNPGKTSGAQLKAADLDETAVPEILAYRSAPEAMLAPHPGVLVYKGGIDSIPSSSVSDIPKAKQHVRGGLGEILAGKPVTGSSTRTCGCMLKYPRTSSWPSGGRTGCSSLRRAASTHPGVCQRVAPTSVGPARRHPK